MRFLVGGSLVLLAAAISAFAVSVHKSETMTKIYESHVKEWLGWSEFLVTWFEAMSYLFPLVMFKIVKKWDEVFFDCFTPISLWLDSAYSSCVLLQLVYFIGDYSKHYTKIAVEWIGLGIQMSSIFSYVMLKSALDLNFPSKKADRQNICALLFFGLSGFFVIMGLAAEGDIVAPPAKQYGRIAMIIAAAAMVLQSAQIYCAIKFRITHEQFNDDPSDIAMVKLGAAVLKALTQCYYCWLYASKGYWASNEKKPLALMTAFTLGCSVLVVVERYVGPSCLKEMYDTSVSKMRASWHRSAAFYNRKRNEYREWKSRSREAMRQFWGKQRAFWPAEFERRRTAVRSSFNRLVGRELEVANAEVVGGGAAVGGANAQQEMQILQVELLVDMLEGLHLD